MSTDLYLFFFSPPPFLWLKIEFNNACPWLWASLARNHFSSHVDMLSDTVDTTDKHIAENRLHHRVSGYSIHFTPITFMKLDSVRCSISGNIWDIIQVR